jgi:peptidoglycan/LPS O-acetylase OafA/YrhL
LIRRIPQLDLLRAVAILLVIGLHLELPRPDGVVGVFAEGWHRIGWIGVDLFFVLSGFLIGGLLINEARTHSSLDVRRFLVRRGLKIYPAYFCFLAYIVFMPVIRALLDGGPAADELGDQLSANWPHFVFLQNYIEVTSAQHLWSIGVEEHFYVLLPFLVATLALRNSSKLITLGLASVGIVLLLRVVSVATDDPFSRFMTATHLRVDALLFGVALRAMLEHYPEAFASMRRWRLPLVLVGIACWAPNFFVPPDSVWTRTVGLTLTYLGAAAFLVAVYNTTAKDLGRTRPYAEPLVRGLCWIGVFSYAIYLWHVTAAGGLKKVTDRTVTSWIGEGQLGWLVSATIICAGVLAVGVVATIAVERPVLRIRDRIAPSRASALPGSRLPSKEDAKAGESDD